MRLIFVLVCLQLGKLIRGYCVEELLPHLIPTNTPPEIKKFIYRERNGETFNFTKLVLQSVLQINKKQHFFKSVKSMYVRLHSKIASLKSRFNSVATLKSQSSTKKITYWNAPYENYDYFNTYKSYLAGVILLSLSKNHITYKQQKDGNIFHFELRVPFQYNINITFTPVKRKQSCPFILCFRKESRLYIYEHICPLLKGNFIPWSIIFSYDDGDIRTNYHKFSWNKKIIFSRFVVSVNPLYSSEDNCSLQLLKILYQPINTHLESYFYSSYYDSFIVKEINSHSTDCKFDLNLKTLETYRYSVIKNLFKRSPIDALYAVRITVPFKYYISIKLSKYLTEQVCNTVLEPMYVYDGPGVLSENLQPKVDDLHAFYSATTNQVLVMKVINQKYLDTFSSTPHRAKCAVQYESHLIELKRIRLRKEHKSFHLKPSVSINSLCTKNKKIVSCALDFKTNGNLIINVTKLQGIKHISYSQYVYDSHSQTFFDLPNGAENVIKPASLCYYGVVAIGHTSSQPEENKWHFTPVCIQDIMAHQPVWLSSAKGLNVIVYSYLPYSDIELKFEVSKSRCEAITIELCKKLDFAWNNEGLKRKRLNIYLFSKKPLHNKDAQDVFSQDFVTLFKAVLQSNTCLGINIVKIQVNNQRQCSKLGLVLESIRSVKSSLTSKGYISIEHYYKNVLPKKYISVQTEKESMFFETKKYHLIKSSRYVQFQLIHKQAEVLSVLSSIIVTAMEHTGSNQMQSEAIITSTNIHYLSDMNIDTKPTCLKLVANSSMSIDDAVQHFYIESWYASDIYVKPDTHCFKSSAKNNACYFDDHNDLACIMFGRMCDPSLTPPDVHQCCPAGYGSFFETIRVRKAVNVNLGISSFYVDGTTEIKGVNQRFQINLRRQAPRKTRTEKTVGALIQVVKSKRISLILEKQNSQQCYQRNVNKHLPNGAGKNTIFFIGSVSYRYHEYKMFYKVKREVRWHAWQPFFHPHYLYFNPKNRKLNLTELYTMNKTRPYYMCFDHITCEGFVTYEPDLVSWEYANKHCKENNMKLLTIASKEEELHAVSLQTFIGKDGKRYDRQLIYLGLHTKVRNIAKWRLFWCWLCQ